jgi:DNA-binding transcriptional LysR family regulator
MTFWRVDETVEFAANLSCRPSGRLKVTAGIGFGMEVVTEILSAFSLDFPDVEIMLDLTSRMPEIQRGALVRVLPEWRVPSVDVSLVMPPGRDRSPAVRAFIAFIRRETAGNPRWFDV